MNILASYNWLKEYLHTSKNAEDFARELSLKSMSVESIEYVKNRFEHMVIGEITEIKPHPDADKLKIAITNIGDRSVEVVCGGTNIREKQRVVVALPGAKVRWHGEGELIELKPTKIRGVASEGMICAANEIGFEKLPQNDGEIWDITESVQAKPGTNVAEALGIDDVLFDIEVTTNRPDAMSIVGLAREGGAVTGDEFKFEPSKIESPNGETLPLSVRVEADEVPRYMAVAIDGVRVESSPMWLQQKLLLAGYKPINNIVDITNYVLHEYGQPLHAFDYDKLEGAEIIVRNAKAGERMLALDDMEYELRAEDVVIADAKKPVAIGGVMGGKESGTWNETTRIVFEAANFDAIRVRRTARALNLYSQSQSQFEKGLSTESLPAALARAVELTLEIAGGCVASKIIDVQANAYKPKSFTFNPDRARKMIGVELSTEDMLDSLAKLGFEAKKKGDGYEVNVPYWRDKDIEDGVDFTEEIARLYGYHKLEPVLPNGAPAFQVEDPAIAREDWLKDMLLAAGYTELYGYSFVSEQDLLAYDLDPSKAVRILNELSADQTHMRTSLMPSVLRDIERNQASVPSASVFELQNIYLAREKSIPEQRTQLVIASYGSGDAEEIFFKVKGLLEYFFAETSANITFKRLQGDDRWHATRAAEVRINGKRIGTLGQVSEKTQDAFGVKRLTIAAELDLQDVLQEVSVQKSFTEIPAFQAAERDIAVELDEFESFESLNAALRKVDAQIESVEVKEVYKGDKIQSGKKSLTLALTIRSKEKTLSSEEVDAVMSKVQAMLEKEFRGTIR